MGPTNISSTPRSPRRAAEVERHRGDRGRRTELGLDTRDLGDPGELGLDTRDLGDPGRPHGLAVARDLGSATDMFLGSTARRATSSIPR